MTQLMLRVPGSLQSGPELPCVLSVSPARRPSLSPGGLLGSPVCNLFTPRGVDEPRRL